MNTLRIRASILVASLAGWLCVAVGDVRAQAQFHYNPQPHWGCFGYCNGPLRPHPQYWGCFGYCNGPLNPVHHYWTCYGYCPGPLPSPYATCFGYCPQPVPVPVPTPYYVNM